MKLTHATDGVLMALVVSFFLVLGADLFAQVAITPTVLEAPPRSLAMFQGDYVYDGGPFWRVTTTLAMVLFLVAVVLTWKTERRRLVFGGFIAFMIINVVSWWYIFPEYLDIVGSTYSDVIDPILVDRGASWRKVALSRWTLSMLVGITPLWALVRYPSPAAARSD